MKLYFSTRNISVLKDLPLTQRLALLSQANTKLSAPEKLLLNVLKLMILIPVFVLILYAPENWINLLWAALVLTAYPMILRPVQFGLCEKYLPDNLTQGDKDNV